MISKYSLIVPCLLALAASCEDLIEVDNPRSQLIGATVFDSDLTAIAAISGLYASIPTGGVNSLNYLAGLSSDELVVEEGESQLQFYRNEIIPNNESVRIIWSGWYSRIFRANSAIQGLEASDKISKSLKRQLVGEAKFFRAFCHFYLVNFFGDVPYITSTDYRENSIAFKMKVSQVYDGIVADLIDCKSLLSNDYSYSKGERVRVNKWAASALLARVYLFRKEWLYAEEQATSVINNSSLYELVPNSEISEVFLKNNKEAIWQLIPTNDVKFTDEGNLFNRNSYSTSVATLTTTFYESFELNDSRKAWVGVGNNNLRTWYYPLKYRDTQSSASGMEYYTMLRLAEQYLIRAEARANLGKLTGANGADSDLNIIRARAGLLPTEAGDQGELLAAIAHEKQIELFLEWGSRWLDLKRTGMASVVLSATKSKWDDNDVLYPVPFSELQLNPNLKQNDGY